MRSAKQFRDMAWYVLKGRYWWAVLAAVITILLGGGAMPMFSMDFHFEGIEDFGEVFRHVPTIHNIVEFWIGAIAGAVGMAFVLGFLFVGATVELGYDRYHLQQYAQADAPEIKLLFSRFSIFWRAVGLRLLIMLKVFLWSLLFIVPGIIAAFRYALAPYILAENPDITAQEAIERSKALMMGHKGRLFGLWFSFIGWFILSALSMGVGIFFLAPYVKTAFTGFYLERTGRLPLPDTNGQPQAPVSGPEPAPAGAPQDGDASSRTEMI